MSLPNTMRAFVMEKIEGKPGKVYYPANVKQIPIPTLQSGQVLVRLKAAAFNHRELFSRQALYPGLTFPSIMGADGFGYVVSPTSHPLYNKPVVIHTALGWNSDPAGPEGEWAILGGTKGSQGRGSFAEYIGIEEEYVVECPSWLEQSGGLYAAALPLAGLTAYRATFTKGLVKNGQNVLITGIGGGVALFALQFCVAAGANVWVTSGNQEKIEKAIKLGAKGGVSYKDENWHKNLQKSLPKERPVLDTVIDGAGGDIVQKLATGRLFKYGAIVVCYGQTTGQATPISMAAVLQNVDYKTSTMGSLEEFKSTVAFVDKHKIQPVVDTVLNGLEEAEKGFDIMKEGSQFGKIVIKIDAEPSQNAPKL